MAINRVDYPANLTDQTDFSAHGDLIETRFYDQVHPAQWVNSGVIPQGAVFQIGSVVYRGDSDTTITGTASDYVKITPSGATAAASYVASLTGVSWTAQYNGYYDASENLYLFDEGKALAAGEISAVFGRYLMQQANGDVQVGRDLAVENDLSVAGAAEITGTLDAPTLNTGLGDNELYPMDQGVRTIDLVEFAGVDAFHYSDFTNSSIKASSTPISTLRTALISSGVAVAGSFVPAIGYVFLDSNSTYYNVRFIAHTATTVELYYDFRVSTTSGDSFVLGGAIVLSSSVTANARWRLRW